MTVEIVLGILLAASIMLPFVFITIELYDVIEISDNSRVLLGVIAVAFNACVLIVAILLKSLKG